jgi:hypothetical protein
MATIIGTIGVKVKENGMTNNSRSVLKMCIRRIGANMAVLASMPNSKHKVFIAEENELHG